MDADSTASCGRVAAPVPGGTVLVGDSHVPVVLVVPVVPVRALLPRAPAAWRAGEGEDRTGLATAFLLKAEEKSASASACLCGHSCSRERMAGGRSSRREGTCGLCTVQAPRGGAQCLARPHSISRRLMFQGQGSSQTPCEPRPDSLLASGVWRRRGSRPGPAPPPPA